MAVLETFSEVRRGFRQLWGDLNGGILDLEIVCPGSWDSRKPPDCFRPEDVIGKIRVPLNEGLSVFSHCAQPIQIDAQRVQSAQINAFVDLCRNAGSLLPSTRKNELRLYCDWDSRKPEELWIAHLLCLTEKYSQARLGIDFIRILKPIQFSVDVITDWMDAGHFPNEPPTAISSDGGQSPPTKSVNRCRHSASESPPADYRRCGKPDETPIGPITGTITSLGYALHREDGRTDKAYQDQFWASVDREIVWERHSPEGSRKTDMYLRASSTTKSDADFRRVEQLKEKVKDFERRPKRKSSGRK